jgi:signal transduction histidine kinase
VGPPVEEPGQKSTWQGRIEDATGRSVDVEVNAARLGEAHLPACDVYAVHDVSHHAALNRLREQLLYAVAHELRGPLAVLDNALELLDEERRTLGARQTRQLLRMARRTSARLRSLMETMLSAGSIQSGRLPIRPRPVEVAALIRDSLEAATVLFDESPRSIVCDLTPDPL